MATAAALGIHIGALYLPFTQFILRVEPITEPIAWLLMLGTAMSVVVAMEAHKLLHSGAR